MTHQQIVNSTMLETIEGGLATVINASIPYSRQTASEISLARVYAHQKNNHELSLELSMNGFYVANVSLFKKEGNCLLYGIGGRQAFNLVFGQDIKDTDASISELMKNNFYRLTPAKNLGILSLTGFDVDFVDVKSLKLAGTDEFQYISIPTNKYQSDITPAQEPFIRAGYDGADNRRLIMDYLFSISKGLIDETRIWFYNQEVVEQALTHLNDGEILAKACFLDNVPQFSGFYPIIGEADSSGALRGIRHSNIVKSDVPIKKEYSNN